MNQPPYIPPQLSEFAAWIANFSGLLTATPVVYGLTAPDAVIVAAQDAAFQAAYLLGTNPGTRTAATVAGMNGARVTAIGVIRPYAQQISKNMAVSDVDKIAIGVNLPNNAPVPIPPITDVPALISQPSATGVTVFQYRKGSDPTSKAKPFGAIGLELWRNIGNVAATSPDQCTMIATLTKTPQQLSNSPATPGQVMTFFARWTTLSGPAGVAQKGPWSLPTVIYAN